MDYRIDLFALFIFLGIVQAAFLSFFFFSKENRKVQANVFHGIMLISMAACLLEIFLMYTGYIIDCLFMVDFSEPASFLIGPAFYLMIVSQINGKPIQKKQFRHFAFAVVYLLAFLPFAFASEDCKYNSYVYSYHPDLPLREVSGGDPRWFLITDYHTELTLLSLALYGVLSIIEVVKAFKSKQDSFINPINPVLRRFRWGIIQIISILILIIVVKIFNQDDTGDHLFAAYIAIIIYIMSFSVIAQSGFFKQATLEPQKYKSSTVTPEAQLAIIEKLKVFMTAQKPFLQPNFSLPDLAQHINVSVHTLSQVINDGLGKSFFEMIAEYRIEEAKALLKQQSNIKVEEIAEQVGYNSKSSFNTAFKRITGKTPSEFRA
jgi:AraC-like DNA-binding protein